MPHDPHKLVLFDIDGTLIKHAGNRRRVSHDKFRHAAKQVFGTEITLEMEKYWGMGDRAIVTDAFQSGGITRGQVLEHLPRIAEAMREHMENVARETKVFDPIEAAVDLVKTLTLYKTVTLGILTGNVERVGTWKLDYINALHYFPFGIYGEEADDRIGLAKLVFDKAKRVMGVSFAPRSVYIIGDTVHDIRCGKAIDAYTIAVMTGDHGEEDLAKEQPDLLVSGLDDPRVLDAITG